MRWLHKDLSISINLNIFGWWLCLVVRQPHFFLKCEKLQAINKCMRTSRSSTNHALCKTKGINYIFISKVLIDIQKKRSLVLGAHCWMSNNILYGIDHRVRTIMTGAIGIKCFQKVEVIRHFVQKYHTRWSQSKHSILNQGCIWQSMFLNDWQVLTYLTNCT